MGAAVAPYTALRVCAARNGCGLESRERIGLRLPSGGSSGAVLRVLAEACELCVFYSAVAGVGTRSTRVRSALNACKLQRRNQVKHGRVGAAQKRRLDGCDDAVVVVAVVWQLVSAAEPAVQTYVEQTHVQTWRHMKHAGAQECTQSTEALWGTRRVKQGIVVA